MTSKSKIAILLIFVLALSCFSPMAVFAATTGNSGGTAAVGNIDPVLSLESFETSGAADAAGTQIDVNTEYHVEFNCADDNTLEDLTTITVTVWDAVTATKGGSDDDDNHYTYVWTQATETWTETGPGDSIVSGSCTDPADMTAGSGSFVLAFKLAYTAQRTTTATWDINIDVVDDSSATDAFNTLSFGVNYYLAITVSDATHTWTGLSPGDDDVDIATPGDFDIDLVFTANNPFDVQVKSDAPLTSGTDTIALSNILIHADTLGSAAAVTGSYADIGGLTGEAAPGSSLAASFKLWLTVPNPQPSGSYVYTLNVQGIES